MSSFSIFKDENPTPLNLVTSGSSFAETINSLLRKRDHKLGIKLCKERLEEYPKDGEILLLLADCYRSKGDLDQEIRIMHKYCERYSKNYPARAHYITLLGKDCQYSIAHEQLDTLKKEIPFTDKNQDLVSDLELTLTMETGFYEQTLSLIEQKIQSNADNWRTHCRKGNLLHTLGDKEGAIKSFRDCIKLEPDHGLIYWNLANIKSYSLTEQEHQVARIITKTKTEEPEELMHACFALGKTHEDAGNFEESFKFYKKANDTQRKMSPFFPERKQKQLQDLIHSFDKDFFENRQGWGVTNDDPIFIVGLPRVGSTLLEQILSSHSQIDPTSELSNIIGYARKISMHDDMHKGDYFDKYSEKLLELSAKDAMYWGKRYLEETKIRRQQAHFFTDKMPSNFWHIPLIHLALPNAKIIDIRRHPMGSGFSVFKQCLPNGHNYSNSLDSIAENYQQYVEVMDHIDKVLPGKVLQVCYENVVKNTEYEIKRILDYCQVPFEESCLNFHKTARAIRTPSSEQVRQPIYNNAVEHWQNYEDFLHPLSSRLGPLIDRHMKMIS